MVHVEMLTSFIKFNINRIILKPRGINFPLLSAFISQLMAPATHALQNKEPTRKSMLSKNI